MKKAPEKEPNHERWLLTYSDLITLLMIFFVIMYASGNVDAQKYKQLSDSFRIAMGSGNSGGGIGNGAGNNLIGTDSLLPSTDTKNNDTSGNASGGGAQVEKDKLQDVKGKVDEFIKENNLENSATTQIADRGLVISLKETLVFDTASADIRPESRVKLIELGKILNKLDNYIRVEGHTDNLPIKNEKFQSNWELSVIRATNVTNMLITDSHVEPKRLASVGYGEYRPVADNKTPEGRSKNRRVDIVLMDSKFNSVENTSN